MESMWLIPREFCLLFVSAALTWLMGHSVAHSLSLLSVLSFQCWLKGEIFNSNEKGQTFPAMVCTANNTSTTTDVFTDVLCYVQTKSSFYITTQYNTGEWLVNKLTFSSITWAGPIDLCCTDWFIYMHRCDGLESWAHRSKPCTSSHIHKGAYRLPHCTNMTWCMTIILL